MWNSNGHLHAVGSPVNTPLKCESPLDFGKSNINDTGISSKISCLAATTVEVQSITLESGQHFQLPSPPSLPRPVAAGQNLMFYALFKPQSPGALSDGVTITTSSSKEFSSKTPISLRGIGASSDPYLVVNPEQVTFEEIITGENTEGYDRTVTLYNQG